MDGHLHDLLNQSKLLDEPHLVNVADKPVDLAACRQVYVAYAEAENMGRNLRLRKVHLQLGRGLNELAEIVKVNQLVCVVALLRVVVLH